jgi:hypothetical protein
VQHIMKRKRQVDFTALLKEANEKICRGDAADGRSTLQSIIRSAKLPGEDVRQIAMYTMAILELCSNRPGSEEAADKLLQQLGFRFRLNALVFFDQENKRGAVQKLPTKFLVSAFDSAIPRPILNTFKLFFDKSSPFWHEHGYGESSGYFSYHIPNIKSKSKETRPSVGILDCIFELIADYIYPMVCQSFPEKAEGIQHAEWWCHSRDKMSGHQLHYDTDEISLTKHHKLQFPIVSTVWYICPGSSGAPTLISNKYFGENPMHSEGWLVHPKENRLAMFDGQLLHGVVPHMMGCTGGDTESGAERLTFMVGFWGEGVNVVPFRSEKPTANMKMPHGNTLKSSLKWANLKSEAVGDADKSMEPATVNVPTVPQPLWVEIEEKKGAVGKQDSSEVAFVGKYFLRELSELDSDVASMLPEPSEDEMETIIASGEAGAKCAFLLNKTLCVLFEWIKDGRYLEESGEKLLLLTSKSAAVCEKIVTSKAWHDLFVVLFNSEREVEMLAGCCWNLFKHIHFRASTDGYSVFQSPELLACLKSKAASEVHESQFMIAGCFAYCPKSFFSKERGLIGFVVGTLATRLKDEYIGCCGEESEGSEDIEDIEYALRSFFECMSGETEETEKLRQLFLGIISEELYELHQHKFGLA